jgi:hypothetical protein
MSSSDAQKSEVHESTADAAASPTGGRDAEATGRLQRGHERAWPDGPEPVNPAPPADVRVVRDETDDGGPLVVQSSDPDLNPPHAPIDPFPTERKPEIDPPVEKGKI